MADVNVNQSARTTPTYWEAVNAIGGVSDLVISITPRAHTEYRGTAAQLIAEGLIPDGFKWPVGSGRLYYKLGEFTFWLGRRRPEGHKGPMCSWMDGDYWFVRRGLTSQEWGGYQAADIYEKQQELAFVLYRGSPQFNFLFNRAYKARSDDKYMAFRNRLTGEPKPGRGRPSRSN
ncbi:hypothetical protein [Rhodoferax sp.]|uniref:hypothetical protein n=1 Tax=Rhodoferax sp. TaxID=50421 RepID=UPI001EC600B7|nr:hypothetical protein [Rhodoferax sp.]MBT9505511.1 hypothetical protein [Rhodoferax sp.]